jgi:hypothetical protein
MFPLTASALHGTGEKSIVYNEVMKMCGENAERFCYGQGCGVGVGRNF